ncbi:OLC1v1006581C1 [Oldenlandia corymbosa var. corymbosa]|uniref:OLC1v1006581C1 n=1 Tax=Oldenlandia corymbosa var. corymbosa TaxID=529605 RepID=A0AAV1DK19_OLDCO|nr:OLC1v1006581C1 [Oldenlandia corymbosa var. corymbosa]
MAPSLLKILASVAAEEKRKRDLEKNSNGRRMAGWEDHEEDSDNELPPASEMSRPDFLREVHRRPRTKTDTVGWKRLTEDGRSVIEMFNDTNEDQEEVFRRERLFKRAPMECRRDEAERVQNKVQFRNFLKDGHEIRSRNSGIVIREESVHEGPNDQSRRKLEYRNTGIVIREGGVPEGPNNQSQRKQFNTNLGKRPLEDSCMDDQKLKKHKFKRILNAEDFIGEGRQISFGRKKLLNENEAVAVEAEEEARQRKMKQQKRIAAKNGHRGLMMNKEDKKLGPRTFNSKGGHYGEVTEPMSEEFMAKIRRKARDQGVDNDDDLKLTPLIQKALTMSDIERQQNRLLVPKSRVEGKEFLTEVEKTYLSEKNYLTVPIIEPSGKVANITLRNWMVGAKPTYILNGDWKHVVDKNKLREGLKVQLWSFRIQGILNFALIVLPDEEIRRDGDNQRERSARRRNVDDEASTSRAATAASVSPQSDDPQHDDADEGSMSVAPSTSSSVRSHENDGTNNVKFRDTSSSENGIGDDDHGDHQDMKGSESDD